MTIERFLELMANNPPAPGAVMPHELALDRAQGPAELFLLLMDMANRIKELEERTSE